MRLQLRTIVSSGIIKIIGAVLVVATSIYISREFPEEQFADYVLYVRILNVILPLVMLGLGDLIIRNWAAGNRRPLAERKVLALVVGFATLLAFGLFAIRQWSFDGEGAYFFALPGLVALEFFCFVNVSRKKFSMAFLFNRTARFTLFLILLILFRSLEINDRNVAELFLVSTYCAVVLVLIRFSGSLQSSGDFSWDVFKTSSTMWAANVLNLAAINLPLFYLGVLDLNQEIASLGPALEIAGIFNFFVLLGNTYVKPSMARSYASGEIRETRRIVATAIGALLLVLLPGVLTILLLGDEILNLWGEHVMTPSWVLLSLVFAQVVNAATGPAGVFLNMTGHQRRSLLINAITVASISVLIAAAHEHVDALLLVVVAIVVGCILQNALRFASMVVQLSNFSR